MVPRIGAAIPAPGLFSLLGIELNQVTIGRLPIWSSGIIVDQMLGGGISGDFSINVDLGYLV